MRHGKNINRTIIDGAKDIQRQLKEANETIKILISALEPFAHPDLSKQVGGNVQGDESPVFGRDKALLKLGDFRRAKKLTEELKAKIEKPKGMER